MIEMAGLGPGPLCGMLLADMGAEVLRLDRIGDADLGIKRDPRFDVTSRGKRSAAIDLKSAQGRETALTLISRADALLEGFRPGVMERLGLGPEPCLAVNPKLVFGRVSGWGREGPLAQSAGHDINYIGISGALDAIGSRDGAPVPPLNLVGDYGGGSMFLAFGMACALFERATSGRGQVVDAAIVDGVASLMAPIHGQHAGGFWPEKRGENIVGGGAPWYGVYETADGQHVTIGAIESRFYAVLLDKLALDANSLPDRMDQTQWPQLRRRFEEIFRSRTRHEWCDLLEGTDACFAPILSLAEMARHAQVRARNQLQSLDGMLQPAPAPRFSRTAGAIQGPTIIESGQHTSEALRDWGFADANIKALMAAGVVLQAGTS